MATPTYTLIDSVTLTTAVTNLTFSSLPQTYGDLVIVTQGTFSATSNISLLLNDDTSSTGTYYMTTMGGSGYSAVGANEQNYRLSYYNLFGPSTTIGHIIDYSSTDKYSVMLARGSSANGYVSASASGRSVQSAVTKIKIINAAGETFSVGHTFYIYGIEK